MTSRSSGRIALITGAKRIGVSVAAALACIDHDVVVAYRQSAAEADTAVSAVEAEGRRARAVRADVTDTASIDQLVETIATDWGRLDVLVHMASLYRQVAFDAMTDADWRQQLSVDLDGTFRLCRAVVPLMRRSGGGHIVTFSDWVAASGRPRYKGYVAYYVAKAGVKALTEALALELASDGILVNAVAPGPILAPEGTSDAEREAVTRATPLGRWGGADAIAQAVVSFVQNDFVTGETVRIDGGRHLA